MTTTPEPGRSAEVVVSGGFGSVEVMTQSQYEQEREEAEDRREDD